jgi:hypothetical protein
MLLGSAMAHHGEILRGIAAIADSGKLRPLLNERRFSTSDISDAHALVESGAPGKWFSSSDCADS